MERAGAGRGGRRGKLIGREDIGGTVMNEGDGRLASGAHISLSFAKQVMHFSPKSGVCSFSMHIPQSENIGHYFC